MTPTEWTILALLIMVLAAAYLVTSAPVVDDEPTPPDKDWQPWTDELPGEADPRRRRYDA